MGCTGRYRDPARADEEPAVQLDFLGLLDRPQPDPYTAMAMPAGGNIRVGLEDNIWLDKGVFATNGALVERAVKVAEGMGSKIMSPKEVRTKMKLTKGW